MTDTLTDAITEKEAATFRRQFPIFDHTTYLNSCSLGPLARPAMAALDQYAEDWSRYGAPAWWEAWIPKLTEAKARFARLIGAEPNEVTIGHSVSSVLSTVASSFSYDRKRAVVCADLDFPTIPYQWLAREHQGVEVRFAQSPDRIRVPLSAYEAQLDGNVGLVATSHVFYATGAILPVRELAQATHANGATLIVDGYHAVGAIPVDVKALGVDIYVGGVLKWLMGGPGLTFIYVREGLAPELRPTATGWFAARDQFAFASTTFERADGADRMEMGTPSVSTAYAGVASMDMVLDAGPERIARRISTLTERIVRHAQRAGYGIVTPTSAGERAGIVMLQLERPEETVQELARRHITVDYRPGLLRISPHFFNTVDDVDAVMSEIDDIQGR